MKDFIKDVFNLATLNAREIEYYQKYSVSTCTLIVLVIAIVSTVSLTVYHHLISAIVLGVFSIIVDFIAFIFVVLFLRQWLKMKKVYLGFPSLYTLLALASIISITLVFSIKSTIVVSILSVETLSPWHEHIILLGFLLILLVYALVVMITAISKSTNVNNIGFFFSGLLLCSPYLIILYYFANLLEASILVSYVWPLVS